MNTKNILIVFKVGDRAVEFIWRLMKFKIDDPAVRDTVQSVVREFVDKITDRFSIYFLREEESITRLANIVTTIDPSLTPKVSATHLRTVTIILLISVRPLKSLRRAVKTIASN